MVTIFSRGGLGNQLFQYAAARTLADRLGAELVVDVREYRVDRLRVFQLHQFNIRAATADSGSVLALKVRRRIGPALQRFGVLKHWHFERSLNYDQRLRGVSGKLCLTGYYQSARYFEGNRKAILADLSIRQPVAGAIRELERSVARPGTVMVHVRRGDYVANQQVFRVYGGCSPRYYDRAFSYMEAAVGDLSYFVFSDDLEWAKEFLPRRRKMTFVESRAHGPCDELRLMSLCEHHIIANSTFSWWGAWLCTNENQIVIAPKPWFDAKGWSERDLVPGAWIRQSKYE